MSPRIHGRVDPVTGRFSSFDERTLEAAASRPKVLPGVAAHEAYHAAVGLLQGLRVTEARADNPSPDVAGHVLFAPGTELRDKALMLLAGNLADPDVPDWPPQWPSRSGPAGCDEQRLAELVDELDLDRRGWAALCGEARNLVASPGIDDLASMIEQFLAKGHVLDEATLATFYNAVCPPQTKFMAKFDAAQTTLQRKAFTTATNTDSSGEFEALVAVFGNVDKGGDRIMPGAFTKTLAAWRASGDPLPVIWSHDWTTPDAHIGVAYAKDMKQTDRGLLVKGRLDVADNPVARRVHKLMQRRSLKEFSFGYSVPSGGQRKANDGANELIEIDLYEIGPTLKGMNPATELHSVKSAATADDNPYYTSRDRLRNEMYSLLTNDVDSDRYVSRGAEPAETLESQLDRAETRRLRLEVDRFRLEESLGFDTDLIKRPEE